MPRLPIKEHLRKHPNNVRKAKLLAFVVDGDTIISVGYNRKRFSADGKFTFHAEESALFKAGRRAKGKILYVIRFRKDGTIGIAKPCKDCEYMSKKYEIRRIFYS